MSISVRYSSVAFLTASGISRPSERHLMAPLTAQARMAGYSALSLSASPLSSFFPSNVALNGMSLWRRQMPLSVPRTTIL